MKLNDYSVTELNKNDLVKIEGGSWLSRRWDEIKAFLSDLGEEILEGDCWRYCVRAWRIRTDFSSKLIKAISLRTYCLFNSS